MSGGGFLSKFKNLAGIFGKKEGVGHNKSFAPYEDPSTGSKQAYDPSTGNLEKYSDPSTGNRQSYELGGHVPYMDPSIGGRQAYDHASGMKQAYEDPSIASRKPYDHATGKQAPYDPATGKKEKKSGS